MSMNSTDFWRKSCQVCVKSTEEKERIIYYYLRLSSTIQAYLPRKFVSAQIPAVIAATWVVFYAGRRALDGPFLLNFWFKRTD